MKKLCTHAKTLLTTKTFPQAMLGCLRGFSDSGGGAPFPFFNMTLEYRCDGADAIEIVNDIFVQGDLIKVSAFSEALFCPGFTFSVPWQSYDAPWHPADLLGLWHAFQGHQPTWRYLTLHDIPPKHSPSHTHARHTISPISPISPSSRVPPQSGVKDSSGLGANRGRAGWQVGGG